tara:strand:- start:4623 stop:5672 length:1050 start_codon:yes stop_codon:yes gene_type:complete
MSEFVESFGLTMEEVLNARETAHSYLNSNKAQLAIEGLMRFAPDADRASRDALHSNWIHLLSSAGQGNSVMQAGDGNPKLASLQGYIAGCLLDPTAWVDPATWALFYAARQSTEDLQLDACSAPSSESHLSGQLLGVLKTRCEVWRVPVAPALGRLGKSLALDQIDLSILGGEQETGGDFAFVLDLATESESELRTVVPLIFQAKRYVRPNADISQHHTRRGYQRTLLARNDCKSAYIFYENATMPIGLPLPPLVKPVESTFGSLRTDATSGSVDLATYLVTSLHSPGGAPRAVDANEALRMIYKKSYPSRIAIIADDKTVHARYEAQLKALAPEISHKDGDGTELPVG